MKLRQTVAHFALALLLLLSQQLGMAHAVSHLSSDTTTSSSRGKQLPGELQCDQCLAFAAIGSALHASPHSLFIGLAADQIAIAAPSAKLLPAAIRAFDSRAPPVTR